MKTKKLLLLGSLTITTALAFNAQTQTVPTNGLVAFYPLNGNANDASGNGNQGFAEHILPAGNQFGLTNSAMGFTGNSWVYIPYTPSLFSTNYSVSLTFNYTGGFSGVCMLRSGNASSDPYRGYEIGAVDFQQDFGFWDFDGVYNANNIGNEFSSGKCVTPIGGWKQNQWYNVTFTRTGNVAQFYRNGVLIASVTNTPPYVPDQSSPLYIGSNGSDPASSDPTTTPGGGFFTGTICDVRFYNRGLSTREVQQLYLHEAGPLVGLMQAVKPSFSNLSLGTNYQLQVSADLNTWTNQGAVFTATNTSIIFPQYFDVANWGQLFFRLQISP